MHTDNRRHDDYEKRSDMYIIDILYLILSVWSFGSCHTFKCCNINEMDHRRPLWRSLQCGNCKCGTELQRQCQHHVELPYNPSCRCYSVVEDIDTDKSADSHTAHHKRDAFNSDRPTGFYNKRQTHQRHWWSFDSRQDHPAPEECERHVD